MLNALEVKELRVFINSPRQDNFTNIEIRSDGEMIYCRFQRPLVTYLTSHGHEYVHDIRQEAFVHMAWGPLRVGKALPSGYMT